MLFCLFCCHDFKAKIFCRSLQDSLLPDDKGDNVSRENSSSPTHDCVLNELIVKMTLNESIHWWSWTHKEEISMYIVFARIGYFINVLQIIVVLYYSLLWYLGNFLSNLKFCLYRWHTGKLLFFYISKKVRHLQTFIRWNIYILNILKYICIKYIFKIYILIYIKDSALWLTWECYFYW